ncbi:MAG: alpha/beta hydrolase [Gammaproteobacteria bacterium]|nr:alpha/beta hydrolase [Gammaproteobacteria bacterium]
MNIAGPAGNLDAFHECATNEKTITAVLCHPHPQYGGNMHDAVLDTIAGVLLGQGINCLRFNFRGVGNSAGSFDNGVGEIEDLTAAAQWVTNEYPRDKLWLAGYSFGSSIVWQGLNTLTPTRTLLIAPPMGVMPFAGEPPTDAQVIAIAGDQDDYVDTQKFSDWAEVETFLIPGADHFFNGSHDQLAQCITTAITT